MFNVRRATAGFSLIAALVVYSPVATAAQPLQLSGGISGAVKNSAGIVQAGATVTLLSRSERILRQALTDLNGNFNFDSLLPEAYSVRVTLNSFVPAFKKNIVVQPGLQSILNINLTSVLSTVELVSTMPAKGSLMTPDWKWVLRSAQSTRPVLRYRDEDSRHPRYAHVFSETRGMVNVSAGDGALFTGTQPDLGTAFALATSLFGSNQLQVSGNVGYGAHSGMPTAGFRTTYSRSEGPGAGPEITVTMRQVSLPMRNGFGFGADGNPALRTMAASIIDEFAVLDNIRVEYGISAESVSIFGRSNMVSPFARLTYDLGSSGAVQVAYSSGANAVELAARAGTETANRENPELQQDLAALSSLPRIAMRNGLETVQRSENMEIGYRKSAGSRTVSAGIYRERIKNGALMFAGADDLFAGDILPDLGSQSGVFNIGNYNRWGYLATVSQSFGDHLELSVSYGRGGALTTTGAVIRSNDAEDVRSMIKVNERNWASARLSGTLPMSGTHFAASYGWADPNSLMPSHNYLTQRVRPEPGLNISIRQPIPSFGLVPGRFEATAELRNLLEQGYLPMSTYDGRSVLLTNSPRAVRGGLSFIF